MLFLKWSYFIVFRVVFGDNPWPESDADGSGPCDHWCTHHSGVGHGGPLWGHSQKHHHFSKYIFNFFCSCVGHIWHLWSDNKKNYKFSKLWLLSCMHILNTGIDWSNCTVKIVFFSDKSNNNPITGTLIKWRIILKQLKEQSNMKFRIYFFLPGAWYSVNPTRQLFYMHL